MNVMIDGVKYIPMPNHTSSDVGLLAALEVRFDSDAGDNLTVLDYLRALLVTLWEEGEGFSGKRPFGNSGWEYDLYVPLIKAGFIIGELDGDGYVKSVDEKIAHVYVSDLIYAAFYGVKEAA